MQNQKKNIFVFFAKCQLFVLMIILICFHFLFFAGLGGSNPTSTTLGSCDFINHMI